MDSDAQIVELLKTMREDLEAIRRYTARLARDSLSQDLEKIARTQERQQIWRLCDGTLSTEEIAKKIGMSVRAVQYFIQDGEKADLIVSIKRGYPKRTEEYDVIPPEWKPFKKSANVIEDIPAKQGVVGNEG